MQCTTAIGIVVPELKGLELGAKPPHAPGS
jgi:hypothetical protein